MTQSLFVYTFRFHQPGTEAEVRTFGCLRWRVANGNSNNPKVLYEMQQEWFQFWVLKKETFSSAGRMKTHQGLLASRANGGYTSRLRREAVERRQRSQVAVK